MKVAYVRVSTEEQNETRQIEALKKHGIEGVSVDHVSVSEISMMPVDLYVVGSDLAPFLKDKPRVIELDNIMSMPELEEKLLAAFEKARNE